MSPDQKQLLENLRAIAQKKGAAERDELLAKAASLEQCFEGAKMGLLGCAVGLVAALAWLFW